jgi:hypothetical protein
MAAESLSVLENEGGLQTKTEDIKFQDTRNKNEDNSKQENMCYTGQYITNRGVGVRVNGPRQGVSNALTTAVAWRETSGPKS